MLCLDPIQPLPSSSLWSLQEYYKDGKHRNSLWTCLNKWLLLLLLGLEEFSCFFCFPFHSSEEISVLHLFSLSLIFTAQEVVVPLKRWQYLRKQSQYMRWTKVSCTNQLYSEHLYLGLRGTTGVKCLITRTKLHVAKQITIANCNE